MEVSQTSGMTRDFKSVSMIERFHDWNTLNTHHIFSLPCLTIFLIWRVKVAVLLIIIPISQNFFLSSMFESSYDLYVVVDFISCSFPYRRSSNLLALNFILFVSAHWYSLCKSFCSVCVSSSSFINKMIRVCLIIWTEILHRRLWNKVYLKIGLLLVNFENFTSINLERHEPQLSKMLNGNWFLSKFKWGIFLKSDNNQIKKIQCLVHSLSDL